MAEIPLEKSDIIIAGRSKLLRKAFEQAQKAAQVSSSVLVTGESGSGKELVAGAIHQLSERKEERFIRVNCAAIQDSLLESELFGHEKGAFTGAHKQKIGKFQAAYGGSILLDEIGDMTPAVQAKILRILEDKTFERVGGIQTIHTNVRVISSTNVNLQKQIKKGKFRLDLFHRLSTIIINVPPLRARDEDIPHLARHFLGHFSHEQNKNITDFTDGAMKRLKLYLWPGNVRELRNVVERAVVFSDNEIIGSKDLQFVCDDPVPIVASLNDYMDHMLELIEPNPGENKVDAIQRLAWERALIRFPVQKDVADFLGLSRRVACYNIRKMGLNHLCTHQPSEPKPKDEKKKKNLRLVK